MRNIAILLLSDIHLKIQKEPEDQGLVISEFFKDLPNTIKDIPFDDRFCIISGDLVQIGGIKQSYEEFNKRFLEPLTKQIALKNIYCIPGNHDLNRGYPESHRDAYEKWLNWQDSETLFNETAKDDDYFQKAFEHFLNFKESCLVAEEQSVFGYSVNLIPEISVMLLNSAILSNGGLDEKKDIDPPFPKDKTNLKIVTSELFDWSENNEGRTKILIIPAIHISRNMIQNNIR